MASKKVMLVGGKRTPFGKFGGSLMDITPVDLSVIAGKAVLNELKVAPDKIDQVIMGNVVPSSTDTMYGARHVALKLGMPITTPGHVVNRLCGSGIEIILQARRIIEAGEAEAIMVVGVENMSMIPHLVYGSRFGTKYGSLKTVDMLLDALSDKYACISMGDTAENLAREYQISRSDCDQYSLNSHLKAKKAYENNFLQGEITPIVEGKINCSQDEHLRLDATIEQMQKLKPSFAKDGVVTPASASGIVDGACALIIASEDFCQKNSLNPMAEIIDGNVIGVDPKIMGIGPVPAIKKILEKNNLKLNQIDNFEINEAFAAQTLACAKALELDQSRLNIWGGAVALGHPLGASGARIALTLSRQLKQNKGQLGIASACIGGGQGIAVLIKNI
jgi:acetyl-CoA C-acetyltransferase/acetyl-CoA acyltransferase 2